MSALLLLLQPALAGAPPLQWQKTFGGNYDDSGNSVEQTSDGGYIIAGVANSYLVVGKSDVYLIKTDSAGNMLWQKTFGGNGGDQANSVEQTSDGGYIIAGYTRPYGAEHEDVYLIKTDSNGSMQWQKTFGGNGGDQANSVEQTSEGGYIIAGYMMPYGGKADVYLIKTDSAGNMEWQKTFGGSRDDFGSSAQQTSDGGYIIAGATSSFDAGRYDVYLIKTDPNGNSTWQKTFGGTSSDHGRSVQQTSDGGYIIAGGTRSFDTGYPDVYLIKTDSAGNMQWQNTFGGGDWDFGYSVQQTSDGGYIVAGDTRSFGAGWNDVYLIKTDPNGNSEWQKTIGGSRFDHGRSVQQTTDAGYIIAGSTWPYGAGGYDLYLIKLCSDGTLSADLNCNGTVYFEDLDIMVGQWLQPPGILSADIAPEPGDGKVNGFDYAVLAQDWLETTTH